MKIKKITLYQFNRAFRIKFHSSQALRTKAESIIIQLEFENKIIGYGESTPTTYSTGESCSSVAKIIQDCFSPILFNHGINKTDDVERVLNKLENECLKRKIYQYNSALGGIDIALLDALGKLQKLPITDLLGPIIRENIRYSISIPFLSQKTIHEGFLQVQKFEFKFIKVLLGSNEPENIKRVSLVRSLFGEHVDIRVDVNERWKYQQAISNLEKLQEFHITAVEQPLAADDIAGLAALRKEISIPIIVDESMCGFDDAKTLIESEACDILNIKISKCGGLLRSKRIANFAQSHDIQCQLGAHVGETEILNSAGQCFAFTTQNLVFFEGCSFLLFEESLKNNQKDAKSEGEAGNSNFGLGLGAATLQSIQNYCEPIVELVGEGG
jgi:L-alanine-DL-glutamate epimerase-like enolase superfamily enzyme